MAKNPKPGGSDARGKTHREKLVDDIFLQPWFVPLKTAAAMRHLLTESYFHKMRYYFDDWGCLICRRKSVLYGSNGMCYRCVQRTEKRLFFCLQKRHVPTSARREPISFGRVTTARMLLSDLVHPNSSVKVPRKLRTLGHG
jgi:hypothetical protein